MLAGQSLLVVYGFRWHLIEVVDDDRHVVEHLFTPPLVIVDIHILQRVDLRGNSFPSSFVDTTLCTFGLVVLEYVGAVPVKLP